MDTLLGGSLTAPSRGPPRELRPLLTVLTKLAQTITYTNLLAILEVDSPTLVKLPQLMPHGTEMSCPTKPCPNDSFISKISVCGCFKLVSVGGSL